MRGKMNAPYDSGIHNAYRLAFETQDIKQYHLTLTVTGKSQDQIHAEVSHYYNKQKIVLDKKDTKIKPGGSFTLQGQLPKPLTIKKPNKACEFDISYAQNSDGPRWFKFSTNNVGYGEAKYKARKGQRPAGKTEGYCDKTPLAGKNAGITIECTFPGW
jgi:hypothetical protein